MVRTVVKFEVAELLFVVEYSNRLRVPSDLILEQFINRQIIWYSLRSIVKVEQNSLPFFDRQNRYFANSPAVVVCHCEQNSFKLFADSLDRFFIEQVASKYKMPFYLLALFAQ
ncbi:hypothetical protein ASC93_00875 [Massilia sp. Root335]|nr:hypothetical protein ASC93_00875 [Massilia sp. Root335]